MTVELHLGDCLDVMRSMADKSVDAIITDLPYGTTACSWDEIIPFAPMWEQVERICKGVFVTTASQPFTSKLVMSNLDWFKYSWVYEKSLKTGHLNVHRRPLVGHEDVCVFNKNGHTYNPQMEIINTNKPRIRKSVRPIYIDSAYGKANKPSVRIEKDKYPTTILRGFYDKERHVSSRSQKYRHPTKKPATLYRYLILTYTNECDTVLDITMGSGTTGVACVQTGRNFIGCEIDPTYFAIAERRIAEAQMQPRLTEAKP